MPVKAKPNEAPVPIIAPPLSLKRNDEQIIIYEQIAPEMEIPNRLTLFKDKIRMSIDITVPVNSLAEIYPCF